MRLLADHLYSKNTVSDQAKLNDLLREGQV